jgi:hypothetical protein
LSGREALSCEPRFVLGAFCILSTFWDPTRNRGIVVVEHRRNEDRYSLYLGKDIEDLRRRTATDFVRRGLIDSPDAMSVKEGGT